MKNLLLAFSLLVNSNFLPGQVQDIRFLNARILALESGSFLPTQAFLVNDGIIREVGKPAPSAATEVVDLEGRYVIPGLSDMHVHLYERDQLGLFLANGVTKVREMDGRGYHLEWKKEVQTGSLPGPNLFVSSRIIDGAPPVFAGFTSVADSVEAEREVRSVLSEGYEYVKVYSMLGENELREIVTEAHQQGVKVIGHVPFRVGWSGSIAQGMDGFEHLYGYYAETESEPSTNWTFRRLYGGVKLDSGKVRKLAKLTARSGVWVCPTLAIIDRMVPREFAGPFLRDPEYLQYFPHNRRSIYPAIYTGYFADFDRTAYELGKLNRRLIVRTLHEEGANLLIGSDCNIAFLAPGFGVHAEMEAFADAGIAPIDILRIATQKASRFLEIDERFGEVATGKIADFVVLDKDPLESVSNLRNIFGVYHNGRWYNREDLQKLLE